MSTATKVAAAMMPTAAELRERDAVGWNMPRTPQSYEPAASPPVLPQAPEPLDLDEHLRAALGPGSTMESPLPRALSMLGQHIAALRTVAEHHGDAHLAHDVALHESVGTLRAFRDADAQTITRLELALERSTELVNALTARIGQLEGHIVELIEWREKDVSFADAAVARIAALEARPAKRAPRTA